MLMAVWQRPFYLDELFDLIVTLPSESCERKGRGQEEGQLLPRRPRGTEEAAEMSHFQFV